MLFALSLIKTKCDSYIVLIYVTNKFYDKFK